MARGTSKTIVKPAAITLPGARLTVPQAHPDASRFVAEALEHRKAAEMLLRMKAWTSKNARAALREMV